MAVFAIVCLLVAVPGIPAHAEYGTMTPAKEMALGWIDNHAELGKEVSTYIWYHPELGLGEHHSSEILQSMLQKAGFTIEKNIGGMETGFIASWGSGKPIIGINGEFDALPGISQKEGMSEEMPLVQGAPGHGCGHNLFGTYSSMAAIAVKQAMEKNNIKGTIRLYGTPSEETVVGKAYFVKAGVYDDVDVMISWHPGSSSGVSYSSTLASDNFKVRYYGRASHAATGPWDGRSALDAVELMDIGMNFMREHVRPETRIHYVITNGGLAPNVVPPFAEVWYYVRAPEYRFVQETVERARKVAEGAALMTETRMEFIKITGVWQVLPNRALAKIGYANVKLVGGVPHGEDNQKIAEPFARSMKVENAPFIDDGYREFVDEPFKWSTAGASTDDANVSWVVPMVQFGVATMAKGTPGHSWRAVAQNILPTAFLGGQTVAKYMAATAIDLFSDQSLIDEARKAHRESLEKYGPFVDPMKDSDLPSFEMMHNVKEESVPRQWDTKNYEMPDLDRLLK